MTTDPRSKMTMLTARIDAATLAAFDAFAEGRGGRSAVLRQLVEQAAFASSPGMPGCKHFRRRVHADVHGEEPANVARKLSVR